MSSIRIEVSPLIWLRVVHHFPIHTRLKQQVWEVGFLFTLVVGKITITDHHTYKDMLKRNHSSTVAVTNSLRHLDQRQCCNKAIQHVLVAR